MEIITENSTATVDKYLNRIHLQNKTYKPTNPAKTIPQVYRHCVASHVLPVYSRPAQILNKDNPTAAYRSFLNEVNKWSLLLLLLLLIVDRAPPRYNL